MLFPHLDERHTAPSRRCNGPVVAVVTFDDAGGKDNQWNVCRWWLTNTPTAMAFQQER